MTPPVPLEPRPAPTTGMVFASALRALGKQPGPHVAFAALVVTLAFSGCCCVAAVGAATGFGSALDALGGRPNAITGGVVFLRIGIAIVLVGLVALQRGFTVASVAAHLRGAPLRTKDAIQVASDRSLQQVGVELLRGFTENVPGLLPGYLLFGIEGEGDAVTGDVAKIFA